MDVLSRTLLEYDKNEDFLSMKNFIQHGSVSTYDHCVSVARMALWLDAVMHVGCNEDTLCRGALLHDFYLYDWHEKKKGGWKHSYRHPGIAMENARLLMHENEEVLRVIDRHMWPLAIRHVPARREEMLVCLADKFVSLNETLRGIAERL